VESDSEVRLDAFLFGEAQGRILVTTTEADQEDFLDLLAESQIPVTLLGHTTKGKCVVDGQHYGFISEYVGAMETAIPNAMAQ
jgi:phosphoribosylformylglycinamidine synthase